MGKVKANMALVSALKAWDIDHVYGLSMLLSMD